MQTRIVCEHIADDIDCEQCCTFESVSDLAGAFGFDAVRMMVGELVDGGAVAVDLLGGFVPGGSDDQSGDDEYGARVGVPGGVCVMSGHVVSPTRPAG